MPVTRTVALVVRAPNEQVAQEAALDLAWDWAPEQADGGDQGMVHADSATIAGSGPDWCGAAWHDGACCAALSAELDVQAVGGGITEGAVTAGGLRLGTTVLEPADECDGADLDLEPEDPPEPVWDPGPQVDDQGGMSEVDPMGDQVAREEAAYFGQDYDAEPNAGR